MKSKVRDVLEEVRRCKRAVARELSGFHGEALTREVRRRVRLIEKETGIRLSRTRVNGVQRTRRRK